MGAPAARRLLPGLVRMPPTATTQQLLWGRRTCDYFDREFRHVQQQKTVFASQLTLPAQWRLVAIHTRSATQDTIAYARTRTICTIYDSAKMWCLQFCRDMMLIFLRVNKTALMSEEGA